MMPSSNHGAGMDTGFPDVCLTPTPAGVPVPIPYPALNPNATGMPFVATVLLSGLPAHNMRTKSMMTNGDNAGVAHPSVMMSGSNTMGSMRILIGGMPAETLLNPMTANNMNCPLSVKTVPSLTNCLLGFRAASGLGQSGAEDGLEALLAELEDEPGPGLGLTLERERRGWRVLHARRGGRGSRAGLRPGDLLLAVRGGGLRARRPGRGPELERALPLHLDRRPVLASLHGGVGRLVVRRCSFGAPGAAARALDALQARGARSLVLDLRGNPGGDVRVAVALAGLFLEPGPVAGVGGVELVLRESRPSALPLLVLIDGGTASAAEVLAAALCERGSAVLAGGPSAGKREAREVTRSSGGAPVIGPPLPLRGPRGAAPGPLAV